MTGDRPESEMVVPDPDSTLDRLDALCGAAKRVATDGPFELYHRASISVRVARNLPGGPDEVQVGRDEGLALRVAESPDDRTVFASSSGCDESVVGWLVERARRGYGAPGGPRWDARGPVKIDRDAVDPIPAPSELRAWIDRASGRLRRESSSPSRARVEAAFTVESWASSDGLRASRTRARSWAMLEPGLRGDGGAPFVIAARSWQGLDERGWRRIADDLLWPKGDSVSEVDGHLSLVFSPEVAATLVGLLVRAVHGHGAPRGLPVGPGWQVNDDPRADAGLYGSAFDDTGHACRTTSLADGKRVLDGVEGTGTWRRPSFRDVPSSRPSQTVVAIRETEIPARAVVVSALRVHVLAPDSWVLECNGGLLERGAPGPRVRGLCVKTGPEILVRSCAGTWGEARDSWSGVRTPALIFADLRGH